MAELNFTNESLKLLDFFKIPSLVIQNNRVIHANRNSAHIADLNISSILDKSCTSWNDECISYLRINQSDIKIDTKSDDNCEHMILKINYNDTTCHLVMSNVICGDLSFKECISYITRMKGIEKIFIVDDDPVMIQFYQFILEMLGYQTFIFSDPLDALKAMETIDFDLLISDYNMPYMNGFELLTNLKQLKPTKPAIICSGWIERYGDQFSSAGDENLVLLIKKPVTVKTISDSMEVMEFVYKICSFCREKKH